jgi:hypothetical protein
LRLRLKWDFRDSFPEPTEQAIEAGLIQAEDCNPESIRCIHEEHAREMLAVLQELAVVRDAKMRRADPKTNKSPKGKEAKERLETFFETEPDRLERWYDNLLGVYADTFGQEAAEAFGKAVRAWHAGVEVVSESASADTTTTPAATEEASSAPVKAKPQRRPHAERISTRLPVPRPLPSAIAAGHFGQEENGRPVRPGANEVRVITQRHADKLIELLDTLASAPLNAREDTKAKFAAGITLYAEDFGESAARQLEAYARRQAGMDVASRDDL